MRLLLDAHFSSLIAEQLSRRGHDVIAAAADPVLRQLPDERLLEVAVRERRALLSNDAKDLVPIAAEWARSGRDHHGLLLTSDRSMPRDRSAIGRFVIALDRLMSENPDENALMNQVLWPKP